MLYMVSTPSPNTQESVKVPVSELYIPDTLQLDYTELLEECECFCQRRR